MSMFFSISSVQELATAVRTSSQQLQDVSRLSLGLVARFAQAAQLASMFVLPDVKLAVKEKEPTLAGSLLAMQQDVLVELRMEADEMQQQHTELQSHVQDLMLQSRVTKGLFKSKRSHSLDEQVIQKDGIKYLVTRGSPPSMDTLEQSLSDVKASFALLTKAAAVNQDFVQSYYTPERSCAVSEAALLKEQPDSPRSVLTSSTEYESADLSSDDGYQSSDEGDQILPGESFDTTPHSVGAVDSEATLSRALDALKKVDDIIKADVAFWQHVNAMVHKLTQMQQHAACFAQCATDSERLHARIEQRMDEYINMWVAFELCCQQYIAEHQQSEIPVQELSQKLENARDCVSTPKRAVVLSMSSTLPLSCQTGRSR